MARNQNTRASRSNVIAGDRSAPSAAGGSVNRTQPTEFANIGALLASVPEQGDQGGFTTEELKSTGRQMIWSLFEKLSTVADPDQDVEGYRGGLVIRDIAQASARMAAGRVITALAGNYGYAHAYQLGAVTRAQELRLKVLNTDGDRDREGIWGLVSETERALAQVAARTADCYRLGYIIAGAVEEYETFTGENYALPQRRAQVTTEQAKTQLGALKERLAALSA